MALLKLSSENTFDLKFAEERVPHILDEEKKWQVWTSNNSSWCSDRGIISYFNLLHMHAQTYNDALEILESYSIRKEMMTGDTKLKILDSGCGRGVAIKQLLEFSPVGKVYGVSEQGYNSHRCFLDDERAELYLGSFHESTDEFQDLNLIFDVYGSYFYSKDRLNVLQKYYDSLEIGGEAHILHSNSGEGVKDIVCTGEKIYASLENYLLEKFSDVFFGVDKSNDRTFHMKKSSRDKINLRLPLIETRNVTIKNVDGSEDYLNSLVDSVVHPYTIYDGRNAEALRRQV